MSITAANAVLMLNSPLFSTPQQIQGFAPDDVYSVPSIKSVEVMMGVDGILSFGFVYVAVPMEVTLQADSASNSFFDTWWTQMQAAQDSYPVNGLIKLPSISTKFTLTNGGLTDYMPVPAGKRLLQPRRYTMTFQKIVPAPT